jgi:Lar family restriction alleviation protein
MDGARMSSGECSGGVILEKLKPCPFCGGKAMLYAKTGLTTIGIYAIRCLKCNMGFGYTFATEELAIETWNRRVSE